MVRSLIEKMKQLKDKRELSRLINYNDGNILYRTAQNRHLEVVKLLIDNGADVHAEDSGLSPLIITMAETGHFDIVELLINHVKEREGLSSAYLYIRLRIYELLFDTAQHGSLSTLELLFNIVEENEGEHAILEYVRLQYNEALRRAREYGHTQTVQFLSHQWS